MRKLNIKRKRISDGINLTLISDNRLKTNMLSVNFLSDLTEENAAYNSLLSSVLGRGTEKYPSIAKINTRLQDLYDAKFSLFNHKIGETMVTNFNISGLDNSFTLDKTDVEGGMIDLVSEIIFNPVTENGVFIENYFETEKNNLIDSIKSVINNKRRYALTRLQEEMCKNERYGIPGSGRIPTVEKITNENLYKHYKKLIESFPVEIYYVGRFDEEQITSKISSAFGSLCKKPIVPAKAEVISTVAEVKDVKEGQPVTQGKLAIGFRTGVTYADGDFYAFRLFNELLGGSPSSKLFVNVREKLSLCYYCASSAEYSKGILVVDSGIENKNMELAKNEIIKQIEDIKDGKVTEEEFDAAKRSLRTELKQLNDAYHPLIGFYLSRAINGVESTPEKDIEMIEKVTLEMVRKAAGKVKLDTIYFMKGTANG